MKNAIEMRKQKIEAAQAALNDMQRKVLAALGDDCDLSEFALVLNNTELQLMARMHELDVIESLMEAGDL